MTDEEISKAIDLLVSEASRRELEASRFRKASLANSGKRDPRCPVCHAPLVKDGKRGDGIPRYECPRCHRHYSDSSRTSLSSSKLPPKKIREILALIVLDCPDWVIAEIAGVNVKTAQFWVDRCLDASQKWAMESKLYGHVWIDEMRFAPARAEGVAACRTYKGRIAKDAYLEVAFDSTGNGFCKLYAEKLGAPTRGMVLSALGDRIAEGSKLTHDGAPSHNLLVKELGLEDDWCKFVPGDKEYESKMKLMSNCCSYLRHAFESHMGIKFSKMEAYANFFMYRWSHVRKHGLKATIEYLFARVCGTEKSGLSESLF